MKDYECYSKVKRALVLLLALTVVFQMAGVGPIQVTAAGNKVVKTVKPSKKKVTITQGASVTVKVKVTAGKKTSGKNLAVTAKSSSTKVAAVKITKKPANKKAKSGTSQIRITAKAAGTANITVTSKAKNKKGKKVKAVIRVTVKAKAFKTNTNTNKNTNTNTNTNSNSNTTDDSKKNTEQATEQPKPTEQPTEQPKPTEQPTEKPTEQPTEQPKPTEQLTEKPTEQPTEKPTEQPTEKPTEQPTEQPQPEEKFDFQLKSDAYKIQKSNDDLGLYDTEISFTKSNQMITLSPYASTLMKAAAEYSSGYSDYQWYKDGELITKENLKIDTTVDQSEFAATEPGTYQLKLKAKKQVYSEEKGKNINQFKELTSNKITIKPRADIKVTSDRVEVTTEVTSIDGQWAYHDDKTDRDYIYPIKLKRELVSFSPWPTTVEQVEYVIKNYKDPFVIGALYVVAMDNYNVVDDDGDGIIDSNQDGIKQRGITSMMMTNAIATGAFMNGLSLADLGIQPSEKDTIQTGGYNELGILAPKAGTGGAFSGKATTDKVNGRVYKYAPRTYCQGATNENGYAPNGNEADVLDRTKWKIVVDQYPYCFDQVAYGSEDADPTIAKFDGVREDGTIAVKVKDKGENSYKEEYINASELPTLRKDPTFVTVCPEHFQLEMPEEGVIEVNDSNKLVRVGLMMKDDRFVPTDYAAMNGYTHDCEKEPMHYNYQGQGIFSNGYAAPTKSIADPGPETTSGAGK